MHGEDSGGKQNTKPTYKHYKLHNKIKLILHHTYFLFIIVQNTLKESLNQTLKKLHFYI